MTPAGMYELMSAMKMMKSIGPRTLPWMTPAEYYLKILLKNTFEKKIFFKNRVFRKTSKMVIFFVIKAPVEIDTNK
jgi:hypothetical protein